MRWLAGSNPLYYFIKESWKKLGNGIEQSSDSAVTSPVPGGQQIVITQQACTRGPR